MKKTYLIGAMLSALLSTGANAEDLAVGLTAGTLGAGVEGTYKLNDNLNIRAVVAGFNYSKSGTHGTDVEYDANIKLFNAGMMLDYYPFVNGLRLSAGAIYNGTKVTLDGQPVAGSSYTINGTTYTAAQVGSVSGEAKYQKVMPYVGIGFANTMQGSNLTFGMDFGAMIGKPTVALNATNPTNDATLAHDIQVEQAKLQDEANKLKAYPVISMSLSYRF